MLFLKSVLRSGRAFVALTLIAVSSAPATAAPPPEEIFTLEQAQVQAVKNDPRLSASLRDAEAARFGVGSARALTGPSVYFVPGITSLNGTGEELLIQQPLELNGIRGARRAAASAQLSAAEAESAIALRTLLFQTAGAYYELLRARELQRVSREALQTAEETDRITRRQVELGSRPGLELAQTGIEVSRARQQLTQADGQEEVARAGLNALLGKSMEAPIGAVSTPETGKNLSPGVPDSQEQDVIVRQALASRPEIAAEASTRAVFESQARIARAESRPDLAPQFRAGSVVRGFRDYGLGLAVSLPLLDYGARRGRIRQAEASARAQDDRISAVERLIRQEVAQSLSRERTARASVRLYQTNTTGILDQSRRLLDASRTGFEAGQTSILALLEAQRLYRNVQTDYVDALIQLALARAERDRAAGIIPSLFQGQNTTGTDQ